MCRVLKAKNDKLALTLFLSTIFVFLLIFPVAAQTYPDQNSEYDYIQEINISTFHDYCDFTECMGYWHEILKSDVYAVELACESACKICTGIQDFPGIEDADEPLFSHFGEHSDLAKQLIYSTFDDIMDFYNFYKVTKYRDRIVDTIGFNYMVVLPFFSPELPDFLDPIERQFFHSKIDKGACKFCAMCAGDFIAVGTASCTVNPCSFYPCRYNCGASDFLHEWSYYCKTGDELWKKRFNGKFECSSNVPREGKCEMSESLSQWVDDQKVRDCPNGCQKDRCVGESACETDDDCPSGYFTGDSFCRDGDVYRNYKGFACMPTGYGYKSCLAVDGDSVFEDCLDFQCVDGYCKMFGESSKEVLDGIDNDIDGVVDEGFDCNSGQTRSCGMDTGMCQRGTQTCVDGRWGNCVGEIKPVQESMFNGIDDDCDGIVDEFAYSDGWCSSDGDCMGDEYCYLFCSAYYDHEPNHCIKRCGDGICEPGEICPADSQGGETCDGADNDCDGLVDEVMLRTTGVSDKGECRFGMDVCVLGQWTQWSSPTYPSAEICDGMDNNCDGTVDENDVCGDYPSVNVYSPADGTTYHDTLTVTCSATDPEGLSQIIWIGDYYGPFNLYGDYDDFGSDNGFIRVVKNVTGSSAGATFEIGGLTNCLDITWTCLAVDTEGHLSYSNSRVAVSDCICASGQTHQCGTDVGVCEFGTQSCINGDWGPCEGGVQPGSETCPDNELDDDCDGEVDETYCEGSGYCSDWNVELSDYWIQSVHLGHYCATPWHFADVDSDDFVERYILVGETHRTWFACRAREATGSTVYDIGDGDSGVGWDSYGCTKNYDEDLTLDQMYCDGIWEYSYVDIKYTEPQRKVESPKIFCYVQGAPSSWGWYSKDLINCRDTNNNGKLCDDGDWIENYLVLRCGVDDDCPPYKYCRKPDKNNPLSYYCELRCGDGICEENENCPQDGSGPEACDNVDNDCDGEIDENLGSTACGLGVCNHFVQNCISGFQQTCDPLEGASPEIYDGLDNDCDGEVDEDWTSNIPPTTPKILYPNGGEHVNESVNIKWTPSQDANGDSVRYYLEYSNDSGVNWQEIVSDYPLVNEFTDSSETKDLTYSEAGTKTVYVSLPKNAVFTSASLDINGYALSTKKGYDSAESYDGGEYIAIYGTHHTNGGNFEPSYFLFKDLPIGYIDMWEMYVGSGSNVPPPSGKVEVCSTYATSLATSGPAIETQCVDPMVIINDSFSIKHISLSWPGYGPTNIDFSQPYYSSTDSIILKTYSLEIGDPVKGGGWGMKSLSPIGDANYQYGFEFFRNHKYMALKYKPKGYLHMHIYPSDIKVDVANDGVNDWSWSGGFEVEYLPEHIDFSTDPINNFLSTCTPNADGNCDFPLVFSSCSMGILRVSNLQFYSNTTEYAWDTRNLPEGSYKVRVRAYDSYHFSGWDESDSEFIIIHTSLDQDFDGYGSNVDCDDNNPNVYPGAQEVCNNVDDDCDGQIDENLASGCGTGDCVGTQICINGVWGACSSEGQSCDDGLFCNEGEICQSGNCAGGSLKDCSDNLFCTINEKCNEDLNQCLSDTRDCGQNNLPGIDTCFNSPDGLDYTWDYADVFTSLCDEMLDVCTAGTYIYTHTCNKTRCGAECEINNDCSATDCDNLDGCYSGTYRDYQDVVNNCLADCTCESNSCTTYSETITDSDNDGYDIECDNDCDDGNPNVYPGAAEIECNQIDEDCDGSDLCTGPIDNDGDGYDSIVDCNDNDPNVRPVKNGESIYFDFTICPDVYSLPLGLRIEADNVSLDCNGSTINGIGGLNGLRSTGKTGISIENCRIDGYWRCIYLRDVSNSIVENNWVSGFYGIYLYNSFSNTINGNALVDNYYGLRLYKSNNNSVWNNEFYKGGIRETQSSGNDFCTGGENQYYEWATGPTCQ